MAVRAFINQTVQIGAESTAGTPVGASKLVSAFTWSGGEKATTKQFTATGHKYPSASALLKELSVGKIAGDGDFAALSYVVASVFGKITPTLHAGASLAYDWVSTPPITGVANPQTYTLQQGDSNDAEQYAYLLFDSWGYSFTRTQEVQIKGGWFSQIFSDGISMTSSPTNVALLPMVGAQFNVYLDTTSAGLGVTQLLDPLKVDFEASGYYGQYWPINRANASYTSHVDMKPKNTLKLMLQANTAGIAIRGNYLQTGTRAYVRVGGQGPLVENDVTVTVGAASAGTFTLTYKGQTTAAIAYNASAAAVQSALRALSTIGSTGCSVSGSAPTWTVLFTNALAQDTTALTGSGGGLTGGGLVITAAPIYAVMQHDLAVFVADMTEFSDSDGVFAVEYSLDAAEDTGWTALAGGTAQKLTLTNLLSAL